MMKKTGSFLIGAIIGFLACFFVIYIAGSIFEYSGIRLYESEFDQQRNFNLFIVASAVSALIGGFYFMRKFA